MTAGNQHLFSYVTCRTDPTTTKKPQRARILVGGKRKKYFLKDA
jgi:hypothetical protein